MNPATVATQRAGAALTLICAAQFVLQLDFSIVDVALPAIQHKLAIAPADLQWIVTGYALTFGSLLLVGGRTADLVGRRRLLSAGLLLFAVASLGAGLAQSAVALIIARVVQGAAGAMVSPAALSLLTTTYREGPERNRAPGIWQAATAGGATAGIPQADLHSASRLAGDLSRQPAANRTDAGGDPARGAGGRRRRRAAARRPGRGTGHELAGNLDLRGQPWPAGRLHEHRDVDRAGDFGHAGDRVRDHRADRHLADAAALDLRFRHSPGGRRSDAADRGDRRRIRVLHLLFLQRVKHFTPIETGLALVPSTATVVLTSTFVSRRALAKFGVKPVLILGLSSIAVGQLWLSRIAPGTGYAVAVLPGQVLTAFGME